MTNLNRPVIYMALRGVVIGEGADRRGKPILTIKMTDGNRMTPAGSVLKLAAGAVEFADVERFATATGTVSRGNRDHYGDLRRMSARW